MSDVIFKKRIDYSQLNKSNTKAKAEFVEKGKIFNSKNAKIAIGLIFVSSLIANGLSGFSDRYNKENLKVSQNSIMQEINKHFDDNSAENVLQRVSKVIDGGKILKRQEQMDKELLKLGIK